MSPEQQRIKIAEVRGYIRDEAGDCWRKDGLCYFVEDPHHLKQLPDYLNDLNAMHDAESTLNLNQWDAYESHLKSITAQAGIYSPIRATAAHRAEAFLRTLSLWTE